MIEIVDVFYHYNNDSRDIISNLSLYIPREACTAIIGNSGCGKSTLLNLISGILRPNRGKINVHTNSLAYLMQDITLLPYKTTIENVLLAYTLRNKQVDIKIKQKAISLLNLFQLEEDAYSKFPHELSGGMRQRIGLAQTLLTDPEIFLLDEPFNAIDVNALAAIETYIWNYVKGRKRTMVFITHNIEQALLLSDRVIILGNKYAVHEVIPSNSYITLPPSERTNTDEYKTLFFEVIEKMKL